MTNAWKGWVLDEDSDYKPIWINSKGKYINLLKLAYLDPVTITDDVPFNNDIAKGCDAAINLLSFESRVDVLSYVTDGGKLEYMLEINRKMDYGELVDNDDEIECMEMRRLSEMLRYSHSVDYIMYGYEGMRVKRLENLLFPCPFCGGEALIDRLPTGLYRVRCSGCGVTAGANGESPIPQSAAEVWNFRDTRFKDTYEEYQKVSNAQINTVEDDNTSIGSLGLSRRSYNCMIKNDINTLGDLVSQLEKDNGFLCGIKALGEKSKNEIKDMLKSRGLWKSKYNLFD